jgi:hypothetical protein
MTHQRNPILQAAIAAAFGVTSLAAHAGTGSALPAFIATDALKSNSTLVAGNPVTYSTQVPLSPNTVYFLYVKLTNGTFADTPLVANVFTGGTGGLSNNGAMSNIVKGATAVALSSDSTFAVYTLATTAVNIPVNTTITFTPKFAANSGEIDNLAALVSGGAVNAVISIGSSQSTTTPLADIDTAAGGNIITFEAAQTYTGLSSGVSSHAFTSAFSTAAGGGEIATINVAGGTGVALTNAQFPAGSTSLLDFGGFMFKDVPGVVTPEDRGTQWTIAANYTKGSLAATLTGNFAAESEIYTSVDTNCGSSRDVFTLNTSKTIATFSGGTPTATHVPTYVCILQNGTTAIPATQPALTLSLTGVSTAFPGATLTFGPTALYNLAPNGGLVNLRSYIPAAQSGYVSVVRVINSGAVAAPITFARIDPVTGVVGTGAVVGSPVAAGGATNFSAAQIEAAIGAMAASDRPRLQITAPTTIDVQHYIVNPNGTLTTLHGRDGPGSAP